MAVPADLGHLLNSNVSHANEGVAVQAGSTRGRRVVKVDQTEELLIVLSDALNILKWTDTCSKDVAGVDADTEARILELQNELNEVRDISERL